MADIKVSGIMNILSNQPQVNQGEAGELSRWLSSQQKWKSAPDCESLLLYLTDSQQAWPSDHSTPRRRVFGTASNGPQSLMVIISNDNTNEMEEWSYRVVYFLLCAWESLQIVFFFSTILVEMGTSFCYDGLCCQQFVHYVCNVKVTVSISVMSPLTAC